jgi:capsular exopolysaccharide synthesis family protein
MSDTSGRASAVAAPPVPALRFRAEPAAPAHAADPMVERLGVSAPFTEELRILRSKLRVIDQERGLRCLGFVSASGGEGKTTISLGLAMTLAQEGTRVLLIEVDMRRPAVERYLGWARAEGLGDYLLGTSTEVPLRTLPAGLCVLSAGRAAPADLLESERMRGLLNAARESFDFVVVDCPPLGPVADAVILQDLVDGFVFVVRARHSPIETITKALSHLKANRVVGVVFNANREILTNYYSYSYSKYRDRY